MISRRRRPALFLDRDGTIIDDPGYLSSPAGVRLRPGAARLITAVRKADWSTVIVSNQSGVGRGFFDDQVVAEVEARVEALLREQGAVIDGFYYCPHHPEIGCACRKPQPTLLFQAARDHNLSLEDSIMAGDKLSDAHAGINAGCGLSLLLSETVGTDGDNYQRARNLGEVLAMWSDWANSKASAR